MTKVQEKVVETDVLVVGAGMGGCWAALKAKEETPSVLLVDKGRVARSGTTLYCHDALAPMPEGREGVWLKELVEHTEFMSDQQFALAVLSEQGARVKEMESFGVPFERDEKGDLIRSLGRGHKETQVILFDGRKVMEAMRRELLARKVGLLERLMVVDLLTTDGFHPSQGRVVGALGMHTRTGQFFIFKAKAVVLATGMISPKLHFSYADNITGDGQAMALRAGAELANLEFSFDPKFFSVKGGQPVSSLIQFQTLGAHIVNAQGERFMCRYLPEKGERRARIGELVTAINKEMMEGRGPVFFDMRHFGPEKMAWTRRIIPTTMAALDGAGLDPNRELIECRTLVSDFGSFGNGGIRINLDGESSLEGLLAAGVCCQIRAYTESVSGGKMAFFNVFGARSGHRAAAVARQTKAPKIDQHQLQRLKAEIYAPLKRPAGIRPQDIYRRINEKLIEPRYGLIKSGQTILEMLKEIKTTAEQDLPRVYARDIHELTKANEARNFLLLMGAIYLSALERKESRLIHYRTDYPFRDDEQWLKWVTVKNTGAGLKVASEPIDWDKNMIKPERPTRIPCTIQLTLKNAREKQ